MLICTPDYLQKQVRESGIVDGRHHLIIDTFDHQKIEYYIQKRVASIESETWDRLAEKLGRIGLWEYEDYED
ncbi:Immunity protein 8 [Nonomuraea wenchangensis]|uniref:Immunity protein 8 n=1 Tax=Nonomuraea wenchangensis TaxID=568860 RepID=A0A1I0LWX2_9ACTN|nr:Immunity protein 8 [Nonomuraea wenchangensis]